ASFGVERVQESRHIGEEARSVAVTGRATRRLAAIVFPNLLSGLRFDRVLLAVPRTEIENAPRDHGLARNIALGLENPFGFELRDVLRRDGHFIRIVVRA